MHVAAEGSDVHYFLGDYQLLPNLPKCGDFFLYASLSPAFSEPGFFYIFSVFSFSFSLFRFYSMNRSSLLAFILSFSFEISYVSRSYRKKHRMMQLQTLNYS